MYCYQVLYTYIYLPVRKIVTLVGVVKFICLIEFSAEASFILSYFNLFLN